MIRRSAALLVLLLSACAQPRAAITLEEVWRVEGLANPESVALGADGAFLYVSNIAGAGDAKDGLGFISRVATDGRLLDREWVRGLNAPKGAALRDDRLYVADIDALVVIDTNVAQVLARIAAPGAAGLNDVAIAPDGRVLVSDPDTARIYALEDGALSVWVEDPLLAGANGLLPEADKLHVATLRGRLLEIDYASRAIVERARGLGEADGVARFGADFLVGEWPGVLREVHPDGTKATVLDTRRARIYLNDFLLVDDILYAPNGEPSTLTAYRVRR